MNARIDTLHATAPTTPLPLSAEQQIGQIAVQLPGATAVFRRLKLDFCCGGQVSLAKAAADKGLDADAVLAELATLQRSDAVPEAASPSASGFAPSTSKGLAPATMCTARSLTRLAR